MAGRKILIVGAVLAGATTGLLARAPATPSWMNAVAIVREGRYLDAIDLLAVKAFDKNGRMADKGAFQIWSQ